MFVAYEGSELRMGMYCSRSDAVCRRGSVALREREKGSKKGERNVGMIRKKSNIEKKASENPSK